MAPVELGSCSRQDVLNIVALSPSRVVRMSCFVSWKCSIGILPCCTPGVVRISFQLHTMRAKVSMRICLCCRFPRSRAGSWSDPLNIRFSVVSKLFLGGASGLDGGNDAQACAESASQRSSELGS